jgi:hypothetical protein
MKTKIDKKIVPVSSLVGIVLYVHCTALSPPRPAGKLYILDLCILKIYFIVFAVYKAYILVDM